MSTKTVSLSVRVPMEDAEYISRLEVPGATTPSDKLRALISSARSRADGSGNFDEAMQSVQEVSGGAKLRLRRIESTSAINSEIIRKSVDWSSEVLAIFSAGVPQDGLKNQQELLIELEAQIAEKSVQFTEEILRMAVTEKANCYDPSVIRRRVGRPLELLAVLQKLLDIK
ncbi:MAG: hypothetical protein PHC51_08200 [bacterium]|nr:hypothetical protein [bacterium]